MEYSTDDALSACNFTLLFPPSESPALPSNLAHISHRLCSRRSQNTWKEAFLLSKLALIPPPSPCHPCQMQALSLRQENLEIEHLMQLLFQNSLTCVECQKEPCCAMAPTCLRKIEMGRRLTLWMISQLLTCPICSSQLILICFGLCACRGTSKTAASLWVPLLWSRAKFLSNSASSKKKYVEKEQDHHPVLLSLASYRDKIPDFSAEL